MLVYPAQAADVESVAGAGDGDVGEAGFGVVDDIDDAQLALAQLPKRYRRGRRTLIRTDSAGVTHEFVVWLAKRGRRLSYSVGMTITDAIHQAALKVPPAVWTVAVEPGGEIRDGAWVDELDARAKRAPPGLLRQGTL